LNSHLQALRRAASEHKMSYRLLRTDEPVEGALGAFFNRPSRSGQE
jgi:hypothetical protein